MNHAKQSTRGDDSRCEGLIATARAMIRRGSSGAENLRALIRLLAARKADEQSRQLRMRSRPS